MRGYRSVGGRSDWRRWAGLVVALAALGGCAAPAGIEWRAHMTGAIDPASAEALSESAKRHFRAGQFGLAIKEFSALAAHQPRSVEALNGLAASYDRIGRYDLAGREYRKALLRAPGSPQTLNNIGYSAYLQGRPWLALAFFDEALAAAGEISMVRNNRRMVERYLVKEALEACRDGENRKTGPAGRDAPKAAKPRRESVRLERVGLMTELLVTRPSAPTAHELGELARARRLLTAPVPGGENRSAQPAAARHRTCASLVPLRPDRDGHLPEAIGPKGVPARSSPSAAPRLIPLGS